MCQDSCRLYQFRGGSPPKKNKEVIMARGKYPLAIKQTMVARFLKDPDNNFNEFCKENGIPQTCLKDWIREAQTGILRSMEKPKHFKYWTSSEKLNAIIEFEKLTDDTKGIWLRKHALKKDRLELWINELHKLLMKNEKSAPEDKQKIAKLERELKRKDKALVEAATLLFVKKKAEILFGENREDK